jgi:hypothetical protein
MAQNRPAQGGGQRPGQGGQGQRPGQGERPSQGDRPGQGEAGREDRQQNRQDMQDDRQDWADGAREDRQDYRDKARNDWQEHGDDMWDEHGEGWAFWGSGEVVEWEEGFNWGGFFAGAAFGTILTAVAFEDMHESTACSMSQVVVSGVTYIRCGDNWYNQAMSGGQVTYVIVAPPAGY